MLSKVISISVLAGFIGGVLLSSMQMIKVIPLIHEAETYEGKVFIVYDHGNNKKKGMHEKASHNHAESSHKHAESEEWSPEEGFERIFFTSITNILTAIGFSLLLCALFVFYNKINWISGIGIGFIGYLVFVVSPSIGLPPELPGAGAADSFTRQTWWIFTILCTATAFVIILFKRTVPLILISLVFLVLPHVVGAPMPEVHGGSAPEELATQFIVASLITNLVFWLFQGGVTGFIFKKYVLKN